VLYCIIVDFICYALYRRFLINATHTSHGGQCMPVHLLSLVVVLRWVGSSMTFLNCTTLVTGVLLIKCKCVCVCVCVCVYGTST